MAEISFKDVEHDDAVRDELERRCEALAAEFPETTRFELHLTSTSPQVHARAHVTGKDVDAAAGATGPDARQAGQLALDKLERELRRHHDKKIFAHRREAQKAAGKRT